MSNTTQGASAELWAPITKAGQVQVGDKLRFTIGDKAYSERAKLILHAGTDKEEVIYDKGRNYYFITAMVLSGFSNHKSVEVLPRKLSASPQVEVAPQAEQQVVCSPNCFWGDCPPCVAAGVQAPQAEQVAKAEPTAWMCPSGVEPEFTDDALLAGYWMRKGRTVVPLYGNTQPSTATPERAAAPADLSTLERFNATHRGFEVHSEGELVYFDAVEALLATRTAEGADKRDAEGGAA